LPYVPPFSPSKRDFSDCDSDDDVDNEEEGRREKRRRQCSEHGVTSDPVGSEHNKEERPDHCCSTSTSTFPTAPQEYNDEDVDEHKRLIDKIVDTIRTGNVPQGDEEDGANKTILTYEYLSKIIRAFRNTTYCPSLDNIHATEALMTFLALRIGSVPDDGALKDFLEDFLKYFIDQCYLNLYNPRTTGCILYIIHTVWIQQPRNTETSIQVPAQHCMWYGDLYELLKRVTLQCQVEYAAPLARMWEGLINSNETCRRDIIDSLHDKEFAGKFMGMLQSNVQECLPQKNTFPAVKIFQSNTVEYNNRFCFEILGNCLFKRRNDDDDDLYIRLREATQSSMSFIYNDRGDMQDNSYIAGMMAPGYGPKSANKH
jgi:hypothetical protein